MSAYAVKVEGLSKVYRVGKKLRYRTLRDDIQQTAARLLGKKDASSSQENQRRGAPIESGRIFALKDVSFELPAGQSTGIIGSNGAGKTTLLKILAHITAPTKGHVRLRGRVGSLLEVGTGFHPELTGRENIYLNGAILGMRKQEIDRKFDEIVAFSEIERFLDTPVKFYSSGMGVRLAFSVAAHLEPEILLLDEVLAVGDVNFQKKSLNKMGDVVRGGRTVLFVSHNLAAVKALCQTAIYLEQGQLRYQGDVSAAIDAYLGGGELQNLPFVERAASQHLPMQITSVSVLDNSGEVTARLPHDSPFTLRIQAVARQATHQVYPEITILDSDLGAVITSSYFQPEGEDGMRSYLPGQYTFQVRVPAPLLTPGNYRLSAMLMRKARRKVLTLDRVEHVCPFEIYDNGSIQARYGLKWSGKLATPLDWEITTE